MVANHLTGVFWSEPYVVANATFAVATAAATPDFAAFSAGAWYNLGPFGVALFFLISGFVIPISLERQTARGFLVARALRIYPTYLVAFAIELACIVLSAHLWGRPFTYGPRILVGNALLIADAARVPSVDLVNWTLMVELKFYLTIALVAPLIRRGSLVTLAAIAAVILFVSRFSHQIFTVVPALGMPLLVFEENALYVLFMLIGVVFSYHAREKIRTAVAIAAVLALFAAFVICWPLTFFRGSFPVVTVNYAYALVVFAMLYALRARVPDGAVARFFAAISYPLYLVHALVGYCVMRGLLALHWPPLLATIVAFALVVAIAYALHVTVERRSQALGKALAARWFPASAS